ncbi:MAG: glycosyltransferase [Symploca sp. SIO1A3]|nr:glycosyltransferase [Symploca sp. SIO1A3]
MNFDPIIIIITILVIYFVCLLFIFLHSLIQVDLVYHYLRAQRLKKHNKTLSLQEFPLVTIQLPIYNELYVVERLLKAITSLDFPKDRLEIQVLDDSRDETPQIIAAQIQALKNQGINITHLQRPTRKGYKAGALAYGLEIAKGDYLAIFDADFLPEPDFLLKTLPYFSDNKVGLVQARWSHVNENYSIFTRIQAFNLNGHFSIEQQGRNAGGYFINFNGTAGIWRKATIQSAGGWHSDTLTEDLDLSYRAQLQGWKFVYLEDVVAPSEIPVAVEAIKSQQYRWSKGGAETARKHLLNIIFKSKLPWLTKIHCTAHLLNSVVFIMVLCLTILSIPILLIKHTYPEFSLFFTVINVFFLAFINLLLFYFVSTTNKSSKTSDRIIYFVFTFPAFLCFSMSLALQNGIATIMGFLGKHTTFVRTPKFNVFNQKQNWYGNKYFSKKIKPLTFIEILLVIYYLSGVYLGFVLQDFGLLPFHLFLACGYTLLSGGVIYQVWRPNK